MVGMKISDLISELELYRSLCLVDKERGSSYEYARNKIADVSGIKAASYMDAPSQGDKDESLILNIIKHCDENTQDELIDSFGEDSLVAQVIRKNRIRKYGASKKVHYPYDVLKESITNEIRGVRKSDNPLYDSVCTYMERIGFIKDSDFYNSIGMQRQQFARIRDAVNTLSKKTVLWIIVGLRLNYHEASDLLKKAGYSFRKSDIRDVILTYILRNVDYDLYTVNEVLNHFGVESFC